MYIEANMLNNWLYGMGGSKHMSHHKINHAPDKHPFSQHIQWCRHPMVDQQLALMVLQCKVMPVFRISLAFRRFDVKVKFQRQILSDGFYVFEGIQGIIFRKLAPISDFRDGSFMHWLYHTTAMLQTSYSYQWWSNYNHCDYCGEGREAATVTVLSDR